MAKHADVFAQMAGNDALFFELVVTFLSSHVFSNPVEPHSVGSPFEGEDFVESDFSETVECDAISELEILSELVGEF